MYLKDKTKDNWSSFTDESMTVVQYDDGTTKPFTLSDIELTFGKYKGMTLGELTDVGYLHWLATSDNQFQVVMAKRRLTELTQ